jgi:hypothetical protein
MAVSWRGLAYETHAASQPRVWRETNYTVRYSDATAPRRGARLIARALPAAPGIGGAGPCGAGSSRKPPVTAVLLAETGDRG